jgi:hypothetical protein
MGECILRKFWMSAVDFISYRTPTVKKTLMIGAHVVDVVGAIQEVPAHQEVPVTVMSHH